MSFFSLLFLALVLLLAPASRDAIANPYVKGQAGADFSPEELKILRERGLLPEEICDDEGIYGEDRLYRWQIYVINRRTPPSS